jgi:hypothetical protein
MHHVRSSSKSDTKAGSFNHLVGKCGIVEAERFANDSEVEVRGSQETVRLLAHR